MNQHTTTTGERTVKTPLLVQVVFHPKSTSARELALEIHRALNEDIVVSGLRIPTVFCPVNKEGAPPSGLRLDLAGRNFIMVLADDHLSTDEQWCQSVADGWLACQQSPARYVPFQLTKNAWPLDERLKGVSFAQAWPYTDGAMRQAFVIRRLVVELCRYLSNLATIGDEGGAPTKLFLSHAKADLNVSPTVTLQLIEALKHEQPIEAWVDSGDIPAGSRFSKAIEEGVKNTSLLVVLTDTYATREWCREEVLLAKESQRPVVVIDALREHETRSFPYLGNVPRIRWNSDPQACIDLLLKETLRHIHTRAVLEHFKLPDDKVFERPPELATIVGLEPGTRVLYPDPPVGVGEMRRLTKTKLSFTTPMQRLAADRSLKERKIALSMSESTDIHMSGLDEVHLATAMVDLSQYLLIKGVTLAYGGDLGPDGYTRKLFELVRTHNDLEGVPAFERLVNYRGWPLPRLNIQERAELKPVSKTVELPRPSDINEKLHPDFKAEPDNFSADESPVHRFAWARGMTEMRSFQSDKNRSGVIARVVLGGKFGPTIKLVGSGAIEKRWYSGRIPGVLEEVLISMQTGQPVFLIGAFGGASRLIIDLLQGKDREEATWEYQKRAPFAPEMRKLYEDRGLGWLDYPEIIALLRKKGIAGINPLLKADEHSELFETIDPARMVEIILRGISRYQ